MSESKLEVIRHSWAHIMAAAVQQLYPEAKFGIGPLTEDGFYYDFEFKKPLSPEDLPKIEQKMQELIKKDLKFEKQEIKTDEAIKLFEKLKQPYKIELVNDMKKEGLLQVTSYKLHDFTDLCKGPHVNSSKNLKPDTFKLLKLAGAYWKGDEKNTMLTRIYGAAFASKKELQQYLKNQEEAAKRDHRKLGKQLDLFVFSDLVGPGLPIFTPKGALVRQLIHDFSRDLRKKMDYQEIYTPQLSKAELFKTSGHYDKYKADMFKAVSNYSKEEYFVKPMNCPQANIVFGSCTRSYKDLPLRLSDHANLFRDEKPGELSGLTRLRFFSQDDGHVYCTEDQVEQEYDSFLNAVKEAMAAYGLDYFMRLSLRDESNKEKYIGKDKDWQKSQKTLKELLAKKKIKVEIAEGEAAFYGPKLDLVAKDSLGREWQLSTAQLDLNMPQRFSLEYIDQKGKKQTPIMIHNAIVGSAERMLAILLEHYGGALPTWLSPIQVWILPIGASHKDYAQDVAKKLKESQVRVEVKDQNDTIGKKIRDGEVQKIPYLLIIGDKEIKANAVAVRDRQKGDSGAAALDKFTAKILKEIKPACR